MPGFAELLSQGSAHAWLFIPSAILLGALHGLEPGHSKTMMAAFIVAIRGTVMQAVLLGIAATISHTAVVWGIAFAGLYLWRGVDAETVEPYFQLASAAIIIAIALWMLWRTWQDQRMAKTAAAHSHDGHHGSHDHGDHAHHHAHGHDHDHDHDHGHGHGEEVRRIDTGHGVVSLEIFEEGVPPVWRLRTERGHAWQAADVKISTERPDGSVRVFAFADRGDYLESVTEIPEPHEFMARLSLGHGGHSHDYDLSFVEGEGHDHMHEELRGLEVATDGYQDAHELAHANDIRRRFADRKVTTWQIVLFGLTGGLIPCPAAITVLLLCLQLKEFTLGFILVLCFSIGLAITLVTVGAIAALSVRHATKRWSWFSTLARRAPYVSSLLIIAVGLYIGIHGWQGLAAQAAGEPPSVEQVRG
ncbi:nickel/cobalt efflux transporter RcnA [Rhizobium sp. TRM95111]|uniref:nickel/cobalt efflux transporter n=1 Tax=Rhizobium alarense TaxID=2846851 RepID=UPI001EEAA120|nr:nickel/cobalt efflux transporter [Rhizobium alarense]MCF3639645.1 nickel/cobalt efflux transporter RcnA [Rhizobium alarense]